MCPLEYIKRPLQYYSTLHVLNRRVLNRQVQYGRNALHGKAKQGATTTTTTVLVRKGVTVAITITTTVTV